MTAGSPAFERLEEAHQRGIRHVQLVHYMPNDIGDFQTGAIMHQGLTSFGAEVIAACRAIKGCYSDSRPDVRATALPGLGGNHSGLRETSDLSGGESGFAQNFGIVLADPGRLAL
jgi:hypothetical protein